MVLPHTETTERSSRLTEGLASLRIFIQKLQARKDKLVQYYGLFPAFKKREWSAFLPHVMSPVASEDDTAQDYSDLIVRLSHHNQDIPGTAFVVLLFANKDQLSHLEAEGVVLFIALIEEVDNIVDHMPQQSLRTVSAEEFESQILNTTIPVADAQDLPSGELTVSDLLSACLSCFGSKKQALINSFLADMIRIHAGETPAAEAGSYSFQDALDYRLKTTSTFSQTSFALANVSPAAQATASKGALLLQFPDDMADFIRDAHDRSFNLLWGMAKDCSSTDSRGLDHMAKCLSSMEHSIEQLIFDTIDSVLSHPEMQTIRDAYWREYKKICRTISNPVLRSLLFIYGRSRLLH